MSVFNTSSLVPVSLFFVLSCMYLLLTSTLLSSSLFREECDPLPSEGSQKSLLTLSFPRFPMLSRPSLPSNKGWATLSATTYNIPIKQVSTPIPSWLLSPTMPTMPQQNRLSESEMGFDFLSMFWFLNQVKGFLYLLYYLCYVIYVYWTQESVFLDFSNL